MSKWCWCLVDEKGELLKGWQEKDEKWYYLNEKGVMQIGWLKIKDKWYYLNKDGVMQTGWLNYNNDLYFLNTNSDGNKGMMFADGKFVIENKSYTFDKQGHVLQNLNFDTVSDSLVEFVKSYEGFSSTHYKDAVGIDTIGFGSTNGWIMKLKVVTQEQATKALKEEINNMAKQIKKDLDGKNIKLNQYQFDALCSFAYNCGVSALLNSTFYKKICAGIRDVSLKDDFIQWSKANGKTLQGLLNRRIEEYNMFANSDYKRDL